MRLSVGVPPIHSVTNRTTGRTLESRRRVLWGTCRALNAGRKGSRMRSPGLVLTAWAVTGGRRPRIGWSETPRPENPTVGAAAMIRLSERLLALDLEAARLEKVPHCRLGEESQVGAVVDAPVGIILTATEYQRCQHVHVPHVGDRGHDGPTRRDAASWRPPKPRRDGSCAPGHR